MKTNDTDAKLTAVEIQQEIASRFGQCPQFFLAATAAPEVLESLWVQTQTSFLDNPIPELFKSKLFVYLSRFCQSTYCLVRHATWLISETPDCDQPGKLLAEEVIAMLQRQAPTEGQLQRIILWCESIDKAKPDTELAWPAQGSEAEEALFLFAVPIFLGDPIANQCRAATRRMVGEIWYQRLVLLLSFVRAAHFWVAAHPELQLETDAMELLTRHPTLAKWVNTYRQDVRQEQGDQRERDRVRREQLLRVQDRAMKATRNGILITDANQEDNPIIYCNPAVEAMTGYSREEILGRNCRFLQAGDRDQQAIATIRQAISKGQECQVVLRNYRKDGTLFWNDLSISPVIDEFGLVTHFVGIQQDVTIRHQLESEQSRYYQVMDALSGGASLDQLLQLMARLAEESCRGAQVSMLLLDESKQYLRCIYSSRLKWFFDAFNQTRIDASRYTCAVAIATGKRAITENIATDPDWAPYRNLAESANVQAIWAEPIYSPGNEVLGVMVICFQEPKSPLEFDLKLFRHSAQLAGLAIDRSLAQQHLRKSEREFRTLADNVPELFCYIDSHHRFGFVNRKYEQQLQQPRESLVGCHVKEAFGESCYERSIRKQIDDALEGNKGAFEGELRLGDKPSLWINAVFIPDLDSAGTVQGVYSLMSDLTQRRALEKQVLDISAEECRRIGNDLHDGIGQELTGMSMVADAMVTSLTRKSLPEVKLAQKIENGIQRSLSQIRSLARGMNPVDVDAHGLMSSLTEMCTRVQENYDVDCVFQCECPVLLTDNQAATQLYRIAQEAITNAVKHGKATQITVTLGRDDLIAFLSVSDNGIGIAGEPATSGGMGRRIMVYRAGIVGGTLRISHAVNGGTLVYCSLPAETPVGEINSGTRRFKLDAPLD